MSLKMKKILTMLISVILLLSVACPTMAASKIVAAGEGTGVSSQAPITITSEPGTVQPNATTPPPSSAETVVLGTYDGTITWAGGFLYSDKWVRTSGTTIKIDAIFGQYATKQDAIDKVNRETNGLTYVGVELVDSSGKIVKKINYLADNAYRTGTFTVTANKDYYVRLDFFTGKYYSGAFKVYK